MLLGLLCLSWFLLLLVTVTFPSSLPNPYPLPSIESTLQKGLVAPPSTPSVRCTLWWGLAQKNTSFTPGHPTRTSSSSSSSTIVYFILQALQPVNQQNLSVSHSSTMCLLMASLHIGLFISYGCKPDFLFVCCFTQ
jgi:hypothetical protein